MGLFRPRFAMRAVQTGNLRFCEAMTCLLLSLRKRVCFCSHHSEPGQLIHLRTNMLEWCGRRGWAGGLLLTSRGAHRATEVPAYTKLNQNCNKTEEGNCRQRLTRCTTHNRHDAIAMLHTCYHHCCYIEHGIQTVRDEPGWQSKYPGLRTTNSQHGITRNHIRKAPALDVHG